MNSITKRKVRNYMSAQRKNEYSFDIISSIKKKSKNTKQNLDPEFRSNFQVTETTEIG